MTDRIQPGAIRSLGHNIEAGENWGQFSEGWIVAAGSPTRSSQNDGDIDETQFNAFEATTSATSLDVTIDAGEAFVDGWTARDTATTVTLAASTAAQTVYLGWDVSVIWTEAEYGDDRDAADTAIIGLAGDFDSLDPKVPLFTFDTDADGVTSTTDERQLGPTLNAEVGPEVVVQNPDRNRATELADGESVEIPIPVEDGETLAVYRWGAFDASDYTAVIGLDVELLDGADTVQIAENTTNEEDTEAPVASYQNTSGSVSVFKLRAKNDTGATIGDADGAPGVGSHFGYLVI